VDKREILLNALMAAEESGKSSQSLDDIGKRVKARHSVEV